jgi:hypothetical protein
MPLSFFTPFKSKMLQREFFSNKDRLVDRNSVDRNCVLSLDRNYVNHLTEFFDNFHLIELFDQLPKSISSFLAVDQKF